MVELTLINLPKEQEGRTIPARRYVLRPRRLVETYIVCNFIYFILFLVSYHNINQKIFSKL